MRNFYLITIAFLISGCNFNTVSITGTAVGLDGGIVSITDISGKTYFTQVVKAGKFSLNQQQLPAYGYFTLSILYGTQPRDFEIYIEPGNYAIDIPQDEWEHIKVKTESKMQNDLSAYYNLENSLAYKTRQENAKWLAMMRDPKSQSLSDAEFDVIFDNVTRGKNRERGIRIAAMDMYIKKHPQSIIIPHIIAYTDYMKDPTPYNMLYNNLSPEAKNSDEGKKIGKDLDSLVARD